MIFYHSLSAANWGVFVDTFHLVEDILSMTIKKIQS